MKPESQNGTGRATKVRLIYHGLSAFMGLAYGIYTFYVMIYLNKILQGFHAANPLDQLLVVLALTMFFESFTEPLTGDFADRNGRKVALVISFLLIAIAYDTYALLIFARNGREAVLMAVLAELILSFGLAFHTGSLDSWFVDTLSHYGKVTEGRLARDFGHNMQAFTVGSTAIGGTAALAYGGSRGVTPFPWLWASLIMFVLTLAVLILVGERRVTERRSRTSEVRPSGEGAVRELIPRKLAKLLWNAEIRKTLLLMSATYVSQIAFTYFASLYVELAGLGGLGVERLARAPIRPIRPPSPRPLVLRPVGGWVPSAWERMRILGLGNAIFMVLAGAAVLLPAGGRPVAILIFLVVAWFLWHAVRPVQMSHLNASIPSSEDRAFTISMSIPLGRGPRSG